MRKITIMAFIVACLVSGCKKDKDPEQTPLLNTTWTLSYIFGNNTFAAINFPNDAGKKITIVFTDSPGRVAFNGICNTGQGNFSDDPVDPASGVLTVTDMVATKIACPYVEWEGYTLQNLDKSYQYSISGNKLTILSNGDYNLYFIKE